jgi:Abortive infection alpha
LSDTFGIGKAVEKLMDPITDLVKRIAGPAADEVGLTLQDSVKVYRAKRQYKLFEKMNRIVTEAGFAPNPIALKLLLPALDYASVESDEELHTLWANLLANSSDPRQYVVVLPAFPNVLRELMPRDARFLEAVHWDVRRRSSRDPSPEESSIVLAKYDLLLAYVRAGLARSENLASHTVQEYNDNSEAIEADYRDFGVVLETMVRHYLILEDSTPELRGSIVSSKQQLNTKTTYRLSRFGSMFLRACQTPSVTPTP